MWISGLARSQECYPEPMPPDTSRPAATIADTDYTLTIEEAAERYDRAGHAPACGDRCPHRGSVQIDAVAPEPSGKDAAKSRPIAASISIQDTNYQGKDNCRQYPIISAGQALESR
jgi:hypothetical protein